MRKIALLVDAKDADTLRRELCALSHSVEYSVETQDHLGADEICEFLLRFANPLGASAVLGYLLGKLVELRFNVRGVEIDVSNVKTLLQILRKVGLAAKQAIKTTPRKKKTQKKTDKNKKARKTRKKRT